MSRIKISKPERLPRDGISGVDFQTWKNEIINYMNQDDFFELFTTNGRYSTWEAAESFEPRLRAPIEPDTPNDLNKRTRQLHNFLTIIAGCCYKDQYMTVIQQSTSLEWIWQEIKTVYQITHRGKDFLNIVDIKWDPDTMTASSVYNAYRAKILENLKPKETVLKWKSQTLQTNEVLSPTFEDHILLSVLQLIDGRLPAKIREVYGPRMENEKFLMDFKPDILSNVTKLIAEMDGSDLQVNAINFANNAYKPNRQRYNNNRRSQQFSQGASNLLFCRLCHLAKRPRNIVTSHEIGDLKCPSLSNRDKSALQTKGIKTAALVPQEPQQEEEELTQLAALHGYQDTDDQQDQVDKNSFPIKNQEKSIAINHIAPVPSQILSLFQNDKMVHLDLDSGSWVSCIKHDFAVQMGWKIYPNSQLAKLADNQTVLKSIGEVHESLNRNSWTVQFHALVLPTLHTDAIGGNNFMKDNNVYQNITNKTITVLNKHVVPETNRNIPLPVHANNIIVTAALQPVILPNQTVTVQVPFPDNTQVAVEPRTDNKQHNWPMPQICTVANGSINVENNSEKPIITGKAKHKYQFMQTTSPDNENKEYKWKKVYIPEQDHSKEIIINKQILSDKQSQKLHKIIQDNKTVFNKDLSDGYNHKSGKHYCKLNWASNERPPSRKVICPSYNNKLNVLLQDVCDQLTTQNVLGIPQNDNVIVQCASPCFLRRKQRAKDKPQDQLTKDDVRLVVNTNVVGQYLKNLPTKVTKPQEVYAALSRWKYIIKTDLHQGFFQNHLVPSAYQWCAIQTPYGGMRYFKRSIQGLLGQTEEQDELLARVLHQELRDGICVKIADDVFAGGNTIDDAINNFQRIITTLNNNNLKISPGKTVIFPKQVDILSWVWNQGGFLTPSPHRKQALSLVTTEQISTIKDLRSYIGLYKTFAECTPNITAVLDPFDKLTGGKDSKDLVTWTPELKHSFQLAQKHISSMQELYLPKPDDQLIIVCDGARTPPAVGMVLQAKTPQGTLHTVRYYSVKLKPHILKWFPCEIEAVALGTSIESFYEYIKQSNKPVIICPDNKSVVDAAKKIAKGHFSLSPKIQTFLNNLSKVNYDIQHISGKSGHNAAGDFQSRSSSTCKSELCQICTYVNSTMDTIIDVKLNSITNTNLPILNKATWKNIQERDRVCQSAKICLTSGQQPSKKSGKANVEIRRIVEKASVTAEGLLIVKQTIPLSTTKTERIVVPSSYTESLVSQLHMISNHPCKTQMIQQFNKYFFAVQSKQIIDALYETCQLCKASTHLPKQLNQYTVETNASQPGTHFNIDVLRRAKQKILICRDQFSSFCTACFVQDETQESLLNGIMTTTQALRIPGNIVVRVDAATGFQAITKTHKNTLENLKIEIQIGNPLNKNFNACVDKAIAEINNEIKKITGSEQPISNQVLHQVITILNTKLS